MTRNDGRVTVEIPTESLNDEILTLEPEPFSVSELQWAGRYEDEHGTGGRWLNPKTVQQINGLIMRHTAAVKSHVALMKPRCQTERPDGTIEVVPEIAGSGTLISVGQAVGILTARHVVWAKGTTEARFDLPIALFYEPGNDPRIGEATRKFEGRALACEIAPVLTRTARKHKGLPDLAVLVLTDPQLAKRCAKYAVSLDQEHTWVETRDYLSGFWVVTGARSEKCTPGFIHNEVDVGGRVDRVYTRGGMDFLSTFVDEDGAGRQYSRDWHGTSGGGCWFQQLTRTGQDKLRYGANLEPRDLGRIRLAGIPFIHYASAPHGVRGPGTRFNGELISHRLTPDVRKAIAITLQSPTTRGTDRQRGEGDAQSEHSA